jgi:hypothetical protein
MGAVAARLEEVYGEITATRVDPGR